MTATMTATQPCRWIRQRLNRWQAARYRRTLSSHQEDAGLCAEFLIEEYGRQVADPNISRHELSALLTGIAGCYFTQTATLNARGYGIEAGRARLTGLLAQELSYCAGDDPWRGSSEYRGVRSVEFTTGEIAEALQRLALAYRGWSGGSRGNLLAQRLWELDTELEEVVYEDPHGGQSLLTEESGLLLSRLTWAHEAVTS